MVFVVRGTNRSARRRLETAALNRQWMLHRVIVDRDTDQLLAGGVDVSGKERIRRGTGIRIHAMKPRSDETSKMADGEEPFGELIFFVSDVDRDQ